MDDEMHKFCVSQVTMRVAKYGANICISSWNEHFIRGIYFINYKCLFSSHVSRSFYISILFIIGRGKPSTIKTETNVLTPLQEEELPSTQEAVEMYCQIYNGTLTLESPFGIDPLADHVELKQMRKDEFDQQYRVDEIFSGCVNDMPHQFHNAIIWYCDRTLQLSLQI